MVMVHRLRDEGGITMIETANTETKKSAARDAAAIRGSAEQQGRMWGARARDWAEYGEPSGAPLFAAVLDALHVTRGSRCLDVGCGAGLALQMAAERGALVSGIDAAEPLIAIARERLPDADLRSCEMEALPFPDHSFDAVTGFNSFQFAADRVQALVEARRVTRPGGQLGFGVWAMPERCQAMTVMAAFKPLMPPPPAAPSHVPLASPGVLDALLRSAGWKPAATGEVACPFVFADLDAATRTFLSAGGVSLAIAAAGTGEQRFRQVLADALLPFRTSAGGYRLENTFIYVIAENP
jgi:SAM-dependent methyltransferase